MRFDKVVILLAAGRGSRMGAEVPKQFLELGRKPVLLHTIEKFEAALPDARFILVLPRDFIGVWKDYCAVNNFDLPQTIVEGGITRFHSVRNALEVVPAGAGKIVAVHDGVRPLVSVELIRRMFREFESRRPAGLVPVVPVTDTLKRLERDAQGRLRPASAAPPDRRSVYAAQTPQLFRADVLKAAYGAAFRESFTDDASVVEAFGACDGEIAFCKGERGNVKLTAPEDLKLAERLLAGYSSSL